LVDEERASKEPEAEVEAVLVKVMPKKENENEF